MSQHQYAMVMDLNKCLGCQTCTMACKKLWTDRDGMDYMYWNNVETRPGQGYPRQWDTIGGGSKDGTLRPCPLPSKDDYGQTWEYNYERAPVSKAEATGHALPPSRSPVAELGRRRGRLMLGRELLLLSAAHLQPLHLSRMSGSLPSQGHLQARRGWHRAHRPGSLPGLSLLHQGVSL